MDFLTRLAQRLTGELPAVQPRLPLLFEPTAGSTRAVEEGWGDGIPAVREPEALTAPPLSTRLARGRARAARTPGCAITPRSAPPPDERARRKPGCHPLRHRRPGAGRKGRHFRRSIETRPRPANSSNRHRISLRRGAPCRWRSARPRRPARLPFQPPRGAVQGPGRCTTQRSLGRPAERGEREQGPPAIHVHIGRVDVRAVLPSAAPPRPAVPPAAPRATLEDYLSGRKGGSQP